MNHTKGPWEFKKTLYNKDDRYVIMYKTDVYTRRLDNLKGEFKLNDAALIAAAPDMLKTLEDALMDLKSINQNHRDSRINGVLNRLEDAIRKAKGGSK